MHIQPNGNGRRFGHHANIRVTEATIEAITTTLIYVAGLLLLLAVSFRLDRRRSHGQMKVVGLSQQCGNGGNLMALTSLGRLNMASRC